MRAVLEGSERAYDNSNDPHASDNGDHCEWDGYYLDTQGNVVYAGDDHCAEDAQADHLQATDEQPEPVMCTICLDPAGTNGNGPAQTLLCGHVYCQHHISRWLAENDTCPNCRRS